MILVASQRSGAEYVDISKLYANPLNRAVSIYGETAVGGHPGDKGMEAIAMAVYEAIQKGPGGIN